MGFFWDDQVKDHVDEPTGAAQADADEDDEDSLADEFDAAAPPETAVLDPATAAEISAAVASFTRRFCEKIHPGESASVSHVFPLAVVSVSYLC